MIWQTKQWGEMLVKSSQASQVFDLWWFFAEKRSLWLWLYGMFVIWVKKKNIHKESIQKLQQLAKKQRCIFIQIETLSFKNPELSDNQFWLKKAYYKKFLTHYTALIDLSQKEEDILAAMKPKWRYNIKLAAKKGVVTQVVNKTPANIRAFYELMKETTSRDKFSWNNYEFYYTFLNNIIESKLLLSYVDDKLVAGWIFIFQKDVSIYYYWASTSHKKFRNLMAPYDLQWHAITLAKQSWSKYYDFLWVADPSAENDPLAGVTSFKRKLTSDIRYVSESYIWINSRILYTLLKLIKSCRTLIK